MKDVSLVIVLMSNGPGELATWVKPIAEKLHKRLLLRPHNKFSSISLRLVLVPCPNATGKEHYAAKRLNLFEQISSATNFWDLLLRPKKYGYWPKNGLVVFLGGDQFWSVLLSRRLGYKHLTYAEWVSRWPFWNDRIAAMSKKVENKIPKSLKKRCVVIGDLMADIEDSAKGSIPLGEGRWIALMPGSKKAKLSIGMPFFLEVADLISKQVPDIKFLLPVAPTTTINELETFASEKNPLASHYNSKIVKLMGPSDEEPWKKFVTSNGTKIFLEENNPAHDVISQCKIALTTVGANTAELGALGVPMIVIVPTQHLKVMQAWDGFIGILGRMPFFRKFLGILLSAWRMRNNSYFAWPNISAGRMVVPERVGHIIPKEIAKEAIEWINSPVRLSGQKEDLRSLRGKPGATTKMIKEIIDLLPKDIIEKSNENKSKK